jgi:formylglycine-generating enzyme required for sulfatase activity/serine/threonine protein kinase
MPVAPLPAKSPLCPDRDGHRYIVKSVLGSGGFGITYRAKDQRLQGYVVVKELAFEGTAFRDTATGEMIPHDGKDGLHRKMVTRFLREARLLNRIRNLFVVRVIDVWEERGTAYYAMDELADSCPVHAPAEALDEETWPTVAKQAAQLLEALGAVHDAGMIHGDVKPDNVLLTRAGNLVLIDFGTVRDDSDLERTVTSMSFTPGYAPPELTQAVRVREAGPWSDLYSWGMLVYGLARPHPSPNGQPTDALGRMMGTDPYTTASADLQEAGMPMAWAEVVARCVAIAPYGRPRSVTEIRDALGASIPSVATTPKRHERTLATDPTAVHDSSNATKVEGAGATISAPRELPATVTADSDADALKPPRSFAGWYAIAGMVVVVVAAAVVGIGPRSGAPIAGADIGLDADRPIFLLGEVCSSGIECETERCSNGRCAPTGFSFVPAGSFSMGPTFVIPGGVPVPAVEVRLTEPLWVESTEVTQGSWSEVMGSNSSRFPSCGRECPMERVSWYDAALYANARSVAEDLSRCYVLTGCAGDPTGGCSADSPDRCIGSFRCAAVSRVAHCSGYRLPTEAEWEYAARAGAETPLPGGPIVVDDLMASEQLDETAWYGGNSVAGYVGAVSCADWNGRVETHQRCGTHPVGFKPPNRWGLYDVIGNVSEWTADGFAQLHELEGTDPVGPLALPDRPVRGGAWSSFASHCRLGFRDAAPPDTRAANLGFRVVRGATLP